MGRCPSLLEAKRLRNDIETDLRKTKLPDSLSEEPAALLTRYIERLTTARQVIDKRISELGGQTIPLSTTPASTTGTLVLRDILHQPGAMSFFMEFMDRRHRAMLPQFYLTIEGLKDPLEEENIDDEEAVRQSLLEGASYIDAKTAQALREDCQLLLSTFLLPKIVNVSSNIVEALQAFQEQESAKTGVSMTKALYRNTRRHIFAAQVQCYDEMAETDWPSFRRSDLYNRAAAEIPRPTLHSTRTEISRNRPVTRPRALSQEPEMTFPLAATTRPTDGHTLGLRPQTTNLGLPQPSNGDTSSRTRGREDSAGYKTDKIDFLTGVVANSPSSVEAQRSPLFREDADLQSQASFNIIVDDAETVQQQQTMEAIQEALTSILEDDTRRRSVTVPASPTSIRSRDSTDSSPARVLLQQRATSPILQQAPKNRVASGTSYKERPGLHGRMASYHSEQNDLSSEVDAEEKLSDDEDMTSSALRLAAPGNLELPAEIEKIASRIEKLKNQEGVLDALLRKADLTGNKDETKILMKSIDALRREISELSFQRRQFEAQAHENKLLAGRTSVEVIGTTMGRSQGKEFALYLVEVRQLAEDGQTQISGWLVTRRFSEFVALHATLKDKIPGAKALDLPQKRLVTSMSNTLLQQRKQGLSRYLQALIKLPGALTNRDVEAFLSQQNITLLQPSNNSAISVLGSDIFPGQGVIRNLFRTVTSGMDDMFGGPSMLDAIILRLSQQAADFAGNLTPSVQSEDLISSILGGFSTAASGRSAGAGKDQVDLLAISTDFQPVDGEGLTSFTAPIANFLVEVFDLKEKGSWLRRQAIVIILQQVLGGTIERKVREAVDLSTTGDALAPHLNQLKEMMWPGGQTRPQSLPRGADEKAQTREAAFRKLTYLMPGKKLVIQCPLVRMC